MSTKFKSSRYDIIIIGCNVSGLLMLCQLVLSGFSGTILVIDKRPQYKVIGYPDDIPYYFNRKIDIPFLKLSPTFINMRIWSNGQFLNSPTPEISLNYAMKIVGKPCSTTIDYISGVKQIYIPENSSIGGRRHALLSTIFDRFGKNAEIHFESELTSVDTKKQIIDLSGIKIKYGVLINTLAMPAFFGLSGMALPPELDFRIRPFFMAIISREPSLPEYSATYCPDLKMRLNRCAILSNKIFIESPMEFSLNHLNTEESQFLHNLNIYHLLKLDNIIYKWAIPGRFVAIDKNSLLSISEELRNQNIFLLGRYATWTFKLTEDVWDDSKAITRSILRSHSYADQ